MFVYKHTIGKTSYRKSGVGLATVLSAAASFAVSEPAVAQADEQEEDSQPLQEVIVTGTHIRRSNFDSPVPITVLDQEMIALRGSTNLADLLNELPALGPGVGPQTLRGPVENAGLNLLNLRRLGTDRTVVLVNGRRHVGGAPGNTAVDISTIPRMMVDRIEVITGGASAVYGADAVSGVVNFVLKDDFQGFDVNAQIGASGRGDAREKIYSFLAGTNFDNDRGNIMFSVEYNDNDGLRATDRFIGEATARFGSNPLDTGPDDGIPNQVAGAPVGFGGINPAGVVDFRADLFVDPNDPDNLIQSTMIPDGLTLEDAPLLPFPMTTITAGRDSPRITFNDDGTARAFDFGERQFLGDLQQGGDFNRPEQFNVLRAPTERILASTVMRYDLLSNFTVFSEAKFANTRGTATAQPTNEFSRGGFATPLRITIDNAFLPANLRTAMEDANVEAFRIERVNKDLGFARSDNERDTFQLNAGFDGVLPNEWTYTGSYQYGRTRITNLIADTFDARAKAAADAVVDPSTGEIICRVVLQERLGQPLLLPDGRPAPNYVEDGDPTTTMCVPRNVFGENAVQTTPEALDYITFTGKQTGILTQEVATAVLSGDLPGMTAGPIDFALGFEWRRESSENEPPEAAQLAITGNSVGGPAIPVSGAYDVTEGFGEILVPLLTGRPFAESLSIEGAVRVSNYSTIGSETTYKVGADWAPTEDVRFRSVQSRAVRAPNVGELFSPQQAGFVFLNDACDITQLNSGPNPTNRQANCAMLVPDGFASRSQDASTRVLQGGNPGLSAETADTITLGVVFTPRWLSGLQLSIDYWDVEISDAISSFSGTQIVSNCVDASTLDNEFCKLITRQVDGNIDAVQLTEINVAEFDVSGIDFSADYTLPMENVFQSIPGLVQFNVIGTRLDTLEFRQTTDDVDKRDGEIGDPEWQWQARASYLNDPLTFSWLFRYIGGAAASQCVGAIPSSELCDITGVDSEIYSDIQARYQFRDNIDVYFGINNVFENDPPFFPGVEDGVGSTDFGGAIYDNIGRYFYLGTTVRL